MELVSGRWFKVEDGIENTNGPILDAENKPKVT